MSNIKEVRIVGEIPFNWVDKLDNTESGFLASLFLSPSIGIKLKFDKEPSLKEDKFGGKITWYWFSIKGKEAIRWESLKELCRILIKCGAILCIYEARDIENETTWEQLC